MNTHKSNSEERPLENNLGDLIELLILEYPMLTLKHTETITFLLNKEFGLTLNELDVLVYISKQEVSKLLEEEDARLIYKHMTNT